MRLRLVDGPRDGETVTVSSPPPPRYLVPVSVPAVAWKPGAGELTVPAVSVYDLALFCPGAGPFHVHEGDDVLVYRYGGER